jgi:glycosyltransferase involved in cell wall biosynthesis
MSAADPRLALSLTLFSSSWKDRLVPSPERSGAAVVDLRVPVRLLNFAWHRLERPSAETLTRRAYDVAHSSHPLLLPARAAAQVITIHDLNFLTHPERTRAEIRRDYPALARAHAQRADRILVPSAFTAGEVERRLGVPSDHLAICPPGAPDWAPRAAAPKDGYVLFFGTLEPRKNVGGLLDAYERLLGGDAPDGLDAAAHDPVAAGRRHGDTVGRRHGDLARHGYGGPVVGDDLEVVPDPTHLPELILAGRATEDARPWLDRISRPPLKGKVRHIGYVDPADRRALYEGARLLVQPSFEEGFGIPVLEAMTLGVPVVASNRGSLPEVVDDAGPLVDPERPADLAAAIARVLQDQAYAAACTARGLARARTYRWDETARRVYETYQQAIESRGRKARSA